MIKLDYNDKIKLTEVAKRMGVDTNQPEGTMLVDTLDKIATLSGSYVRKKEHQDDR